MALGVVTVAGLFWISLYAWSPFTISQADAFNGLFSQGREGGNMAYIVAQLRVPRALCAASVSYTHLTLPTSDLV